MAAGQAPRSENAPWLTKRGLAICSQRFKRWFCSFAQSRWLPKAITKGIVSQKSERTPTALHRGDFQNGRGRGRNGGRSGSSGVTVRPYVLRSAVTMQTITSCTSWRCASPLAFGAMWCTKHNIVRGKVEFHKCNK